MRRLCQCHSKLMLMLSRCLSRRRLQRMAQQRALRLLAPCLLALSLANISRFCAFCKCSDRANTRCYYPAEGNFYMSAIKCNSNIARLHLQANLAMYAPKSNSSSMQSTNIFRLNSAPVVCPAALHNANYALALCLTTPLFIPHKQYCHPFSDGAEAPCRGVQPQLSLCCRPLQSPKLLQHAFVPHFCRATPPYGLGALC